jgi:transcription antitermination factor NusG
LRDWVVVRVRSGCEAQVCQEIESNLGLTTYFPRFVRWRKLPKHLAKAKGKKKELVSTILFPCYIFVQVKTMECVTRIKAIRDVFSFISTSAGPCYAEDDAIETLRMRERSGINDDTEQGRKLRMAERAQAMAHAVASITLRDLTGAIVRMTSGLFAGTSGTVLTHEVAQGKVKIELTNGVPLTLDDDQVELLAA